MSQRPLAVYLLILQSSIGRPVCTVYRGMYDIEYIVLDIEYMHEWHFSVKCHSCLIDVFDRVMPRYKYTGIHTKSHTGEDDLKTALTLALFWGHYLRQVAGAADVSTVDQS